MPAKQWDEDNGLCSACLDSALYDDDYYYEDDDE